MEIGWIKWGIVNDGILCYSEKGDYYIYIG